MPAEVGVSLFVDRASAMFDVTFDYYIPGYDDPETGESFDDTNWTVTFHDNATGLDGAGGAGSGSDFGTGFTGVGFPAGEDVADLDIRFSAINPFSGATAGGLWHLLNAGLALEDKVLVGGAGIDILVGGAGSDVLRGQAEDDYLDAGTGADLLDGGDGDDVLDGGEGVDTMAGGDGDDLYIVDSEDDVIAEGPSKGIDQVYSTVSYALNDYVEDLSLIGPGALDATGNWGDNILEGNDDRNMIEGLEGDDELYGYGGRDTLYGDDGDDLLNGGAGRDYMEGGWGDDLYVVENPGDVALEFADDGHDTVGVHNLAAYVLPDNIEDLVNDGGPGRFEGIGNGLDNGLVGGDRIDILRGLGGNDQIGGQAGNDILIGGSGADILDGGDGIDTASYADAGGGVRVSLETGLGSRGEANGDVLSAIENLVGSASGDKLTGNGGANRIEGGAGDDRLIGLGGDDTLVGGTGADELFGGLGSDTASYEDALTAIGVDLATGVLTGSDAVGDTFRSIENVTGGAGNDVLSGTNGANRLSGGAGDDQLTGSGGDDVLTGGAGADDLQGGDGLDAISYAGSLAGVTVDLRSGSASGGDATGDLFAGIERVIGSARDDTLTGDGGANALSGAGGDDIIDGGEGDDVIRGGDGSDIMEGGVGVDTVSYAGSTAWVSASLNSGVAMTEDGQADLLSGFENLRGGEAGDVLIGDGGNNRIEGGAGDDYIDGRFGTDVLIGGDGFDLFVFDNNSGVDRIKDFLAGGGHDQIQLGLGTDFDTIEEVSAVASQVGANTVLDFGPGLRLILQDVDATNLVADDFVFV